jgi:hypothetical protein
LGQPHPIYNLEVRDIIERRSLVAAVFKGWRFLLFEGETAIAAAEVAIDQKSGASHTAGINAGPYVFSTAAALRALPVQLESDSRVWAVRVLRIPALFFWAMWFHDASSDDDQLMPLGPAPENLDEARLYSWGELSEVLIGPARQRLTDDFNRDAR